MKRMLLCFILLLCIRNAQAQADIPDTVYYYNLPPQNVNSTRKWANDTVRYHYNQKKYYVKTILPYLAAATTLFNDLNTNLNILSGRPRRQYVAQKEEAVRTQFENKIKSLNETQGVLLIKLIARQTGLNIYHSLSEYKGTIAAIKWQTWARLHGFNLNKRYDPTDDPDLEQIMESLGYPLPLAHSKN